MHERGVTLVEVLLALVICAAGLVVSADGIATSLRVEGSASNREEAAYLARELLAEVESGERGVTAAEGEFARAPGYAWRIETGTTEVEGLQEARVVVLWTERGAERDLTVVRWIYQDPEAGGVDGLE